jgi:DNA-binding transcriptional LysR family regulator
MNINYDYYRVFYYVAKCRSITLAANVLMSNQPNVTRTIKALENSLGCVLFVRSNHGVMLTPEGEVLFRHVRVAFEQIEQGEEELALEKTMQHGTISIAVSEIALHCILLPILKEYRKLYPGIRIRVSSYATPEAISTLRSGLVDFAVITTPANIPKNLKSTIISHFQEVAVCGLAYSALYSQCLTFEQLAQYPMICLGEHTKTYEFYSDLFSRHGVSFSPCIEAATIEQILPLVRNDLGIGFVPEQFLESWGENDTVYRLQLKEQIPPRDFCVLKRREYPLNIAAHKLEEMIRQTADKNTETLNGHAC